MVLATIQNAEKMRITEKSPFKPNRSAAEMLKDLYDSSGPFKWVLDPFMATILNLSRL
jgi:hypothetical protein